MTLATEIAPESRWAARRLPLVIGRGLSMLWPAADAIVVVVLSVLSGLAYHFFTYGGAGHVIDYAKVGAAVALFRWILHHPVSSISARPQNSLSYQFYLWNAAFLCLLAFGFIGKITGTYSRGAVMLFYASGLPLLIMWQAAWKHFIRQGLSSGRLALRRGLLLGTPAKIEEFRRKYRPARAGMIVTDTLMLPANALENTEAGDLTLSKLLDRAVELARRSHLDDIIVLLPWSATRAIDACTDRLMTLPVSVQLGPETVFDRFTQVHLSRLGPATMLNLIRPPLTKMEVLSKRVFDLVASMALLVVISPLLAAIAILIKWDSPGPAFFRQRRHGFNQKPFKILKFRTMTVTEDGDVVVQAKADDPRVTRIGRYLRRWNLDELPQLINVIKGDMSLIGPRPHALTHDREYERRIAYYARRHNIKPGITGWAQVNGFRGLTDTEEKMRARLDHDLFYIDNWSIPFDLYILALTILSPKSFRNAH